MSSTKSRGRYGPPHRDEFGRGPRDFSSVQRGPPPYYDSGPSRYHHDDRGPHNSRGPPPNGRWERGRLQSPPRDRRRPPPMGYREDRMGRMPPSRGRRYENNPTDYHHDYHRKHHRGRRLERSRSRSNSSRRSYSSSSSSSSFSSDASSSYDSRRSMSRSPSRSRSRSYSRSPSMSPSPTKSKKEESINNSVKEETILSSSENNGNHKQVQSGENEAKEKAVSPSSKGSTSSPRRKRTRSHSKDREGDLPHDSTNDRERSRESRESSRKHRGRSDSRSRGSSVSRSRSHSPRSRSRSRSASSGYDSRSVGSSRRHRRRERERRRDHKRHRKRSRRDKISKRTSSEDSAKNDMDALSKDQRTVFVSQLVMRTTERDLKKYFKRKVGCKVNDVILLRDRRNARNHKGCAYVEVGRIEDVSKAVGVSGQPPDFQRFPILVKASEAEKNYHATVNAATSVKASDLQTASSSPVGPSSTNLVVLPPLRDANGRLIESQKVYVGGLDPSVGEEHLRAVFSQFGTLYHINLQSDPVSGISKGFAFLTFRDPKVSNLAIRTMGGQLLAGRPLKTGWATQNQQTASSLAAGYTLVTSEEFPEDATALTQKALLVLAQLSGGVPPSIAAASSSLSTNQTSSLAEAELDKAMGASASPPTAAASNPPGSVAEARASLAADVAARQLAAVQANASAKSQFIANSHLSATSCTLLVYNMYNKDEETEPGWQDDIREEFVDECSRFGSIESVTVLHEEPGGKIRVKFGTPEAAQNCANNLAGRWFDQRQLKVEYLSEEKA